MQLMTAEIQTWLSAPKKIERAPHRVHCGIPHTFMRCGQKGWAYGFERGWQVPVWQQALDPTGRQPGHTGPYCLLPVGQAGQQPARSRVQAAHIKCKMERMLTEKGCCPQPRMQGPKKWNVMVPREGTIPLYWWGTWAEARRQSRPPGKKALSTFLPSLLELWTWQLHWRKGSSNSKCCESGIPILEE